MKGVLSEKWITDLNEDVVAPPAIIQRQHQASIIVGTKKGKLVSLDTQGNTLWVCDIQSESLSETDKLFLDDEEVFSINTTPKIVVDKTAAQVVIIVGTEEGKVHCVSEDGKKKWELKTEGPIRAQPSTMIAGPEKKVYLLVGSHDEHLYIISLDGKIIKKIPVTGKVETTPVIVGTKIIFGTASGEAHAYTIDGKKLWTLQTAKKISANITHTKDLDGNNIILIPSEDGLLYAVSDDGELLWKYATRGAILTKPVVVQLSPESKEVLFGSADNSVYCLSLHEGEEIWSYETDFWVASTPLIEKTNEHTYAIVGSYDTHLYVFDMQGSYELDFIPGLGGVVNQGTYQASSMGQDAGEDKGKVLSQYHMQEFIVGCDLHAASGAVIAVTKKGKVFNLLLT